MAFKGAQLTYLSAKNAFQSGPAMKVAFIGVLLIPVIFAGFYLSAFYDPYASLNTVAVAVVNEDEGAEINGERRNVGESVCDTLRDEKEGLQWNFVNAEEARAGMEAGKYYMSCTIPKDFSASIASAEKDHPEKADLVVVYDQSNNMLASQIGQTVWKTLQQKMNNTIIQEYWDATFSKMNDAADGLMEAADGAGQLADGLGSAVTGNITITSKLRELQAGSAKLEEGLGTLAEGSSKLDEGVQTLAEGMGTLSTGSNTLNSGIQKLNKQSQALGSLPNATKQLADGAAQVSDGVNSVNTYIVKVSDSGKLIATNLTNTGGYLSKAGNAVGAAMKIIGTSNPNATKQLNTALGAIQSAGGEVESAGKTLAGLSSGSDPSQLKKLSEGAAAVSGGLSELNKQLEGSVPALSAGVSQIAKGSNQVNSGVQSANEGTAQLAENTPTLAEGAQSAHDGAEQITAGAGALADGSQTLGDGLVKAQDGSKELQSGLVDGAEQMTFTTAQIDARSNMMNEPVNLDEEYFTTVDNYGTGFAPFFLGLAIWVGCLFAGFLFKPLNKRLSISGRNPLLVAFVGYVPLAIFAILQTIIAQLFVQFVLGAHIANVPMYYALGIICALVFTAIMQYLVAAFSFPGRFIAVVLLTLQLTSSAGTFPVQMTPGFFQAVNPWMPMSYFVEAMRQIMTGTNMNLVFSNIGILFVFGIVFFILTSIVAYRHRTVKMTQIHPLLDL